MATVLSNVRIVDATGERSATVTIDGGLIVAVEPAEVSPDATIVTPGLIDVHTHGGGGFALHTTDPEQLRSYARWAPSTGTTAFLAGVVGVPDGLPLRQLDAVRATRDMAADGAETLGVHLEGPYMSVERRGAHDPSWLRTPDDAETTLLLDRYGDLLHIVTIAPELPGAERLIRRLVAAGITASVGHTDADEAQTVAAFGWGATHMTHCFNAMRVLGHRAPGPLGALVTHPHARGELIADGVHVEAAAFRLLARALGAARTIVITDALAGAGMPDAVFQFAGNTARVIDGVARLPDGTITGSVITMDQALRNTLRFTGWTLAEVVGSLTRTPALAAGVADRKGLIAPGYDADLVVWDRDLRLQATMCRGVWVYHAPKS